MPSRHALLGASSAYRWLECTPSARLCETLPDKSSTYAEEGTRAHDMCEQKLKKLIGIVDDFDFPSGDDIDKEMDTYTDAYRDYIEETLNTAKARTKDAKLFIEHELNFEDYVPEGFGTSDAVIIDDTTLNVIDFKYGKGVVVDAQGNPQLRLYALGAYLSLGSLYDFDTVKMTIVQPRADHISVEVLPVEELLDWAYNYVKPRAELAFKGEGEYVVGDHCRFCKAGGTCRARAQEAFKIVEKSATNPALIDDVEIPDILDKLDNTEEWIKAIRKYAEEKAIHEGIEWRGYKIVESRTQRKIVDQIAVLDVLESAGIDAEDVTTVKLKGITDLEKILGKKQFNDLLKGFVVKPQGAPILVKETDKREKFNPGKEAFKEELE